MITDLVQIQRLGENKREENFRFRRWLKSHDHNERRLRRIAGEVCGQIDCTACGNCCRVATAKVTDRDAARLAKFLGVKFNVFLRDYTQAEPEDGRVLKRDDERGCVFLSGNVCTVYEARPSACELFPHMVKGEGSLASRMWHFVDRASYCPIVYNAMEAWKEDTHFSPVAR